nr:glycosyltransferase [Bernardetiaceae bacterium]
MPASPRCSVIIRCFNEAKHIGKLLAHLAQQTERAVEVIVVDSGSTDGTVAIAQSHGAKVLAISPQEFTFGRALNRGLAAATAPLAVLASAHVYPVSPTWLEHLLAPFDQDPALALTYGAQVGNERTQFSEHQIFRKWFPPEGPWYRQDHPFCNNANAAIRRAVWQAQPYDEALTGLEDLDWAKRALAAGHRLAYVPSAAIVHVHEETPARVRNRYRREAIAYKRIFPEAHFTLGDFLLLFPTNVLSDWAQA